MGRVIKLIILLVLLAAGLAGGWYYYKGGGQGERVSYRLAPVERGGLISTVSATGTLNAVVTVEVGSQVSGQIKELMADFNSEVRQDQVIALIDPENFEARVRQAEAELLVAQANVAIQKAAVDKALSELHNARADLVATKAQAEKARIGLAEAKRDMDRQQALFSRGATSRSQSDTAAANYDQARAQLSTVEAQQQAQASLVSSREAALKMAQAQVEQAQAQVKQKEAALHQSRLDLSHTVIRSPVDGVVVGRSVDIGQTVAASLQAPTLFTIAQNLRKMQVEANLDEADIGRIQVGQRTTFTVDAFPGREFRGEIKQIRKAPQTVQNVVTYTVIISAENPDLSLLPGMTANVSIVAAERASALKVPNAALRFRPASAGGAAQAAGPAAQGQDRLSRGGSGRGAELLGRMTESLGLSPEQRAQVKAILEEGRARIAALRRQGGSAEDLKAEAERLREQNRNAILGLLTPEQREKFNRLSQARAASPITPGRVWRLGQDDRPSPVDLRTGISDGSFTEVVSGEIKAGEQVIVGTNQAARGQAAPSGGRRFGF